MMDEVRVALERLLPLTLNEAEYNDPMVTVAGPNWSLGVACPWRLMREGRLVVSYGDPAADAAVAQLVGSEVVAIGCAAGSRVPGDIRLVFADGSVLDLFPDTDLDPWVLHLPGETFVGTASCR